MKVTEKLDKLISVLASNPYNATIKTELEKLRASVTSTSLDSRIYKVMSRLGFTSSLIGYEYTKCGIELIMQDDEYRKQITDLLYPQIAELCSTTKSRAERAIRHSIENAWDRCDPDVVEEVFGNTVSPSKGKPTNAEFLSHIAKYISLDLDLE